MANCGELAAPRAGPREREDVRILSVDLDVIKRSFEINVLDVSGSAERTFQCPQFARGLPPHDRVEQSMHVPSLTASLKWHIWR